MKTISIIDNHLRQLLHDSMIVNSLKFGEISNIIDEIGISDLHTVNMDRAMNILYCCSDDICVIQNCYYTWKTTGEELSEEVKSVERLIIQLGILVNLSHLYEINIYDMSFPKNKDTLFDTDIEFRSRVKKLILKFSITKPDESEELYKLLIIHARFYTLQIFGISYIPTLIQSIGNTIYTTGIKFGEFLYEIIDSSREHILKHFYENIRVEDSGTFLKETFTKVTDLMLQVFSLERVLDMEAKLDIAYRDYISDMTKVTIKDNPKESVECKSVSKNDKEENNMFENLFNGMFGKVDEGLCRIAMNGKIAIKCEDGNFKTYNIATDRLTNVSNFVFNGMDEMFFVIPTNKVKKGDIIIVKGKPRFVISINNEGNRLKVLNYETDVIEEVLPERHIFLGKMYFYGKIVSLIGNFLGKSSQNGLMKMMMISQMMSGSGETQDMFSGLFGNEKSKSNPFMQMLLMQSIFGGNGGFDSIFEDLFDDSGDDSSFLSLFDDEDGVILSENSNPTEND